MGIEAKKKTKSFDFQLVKWYSRESITLTRNYSPHRTTLLFVLRYLSCLSDSQSPEPVHIHTHTHIYFFFTRKEEVGEHCSLGMSDDFQKTRYPVLDNHFPARLDNILCMYICIYTTHRRMRECHHRQWAHLRYIDSDAKLLIYGSSSVVEKRE